MASAAGGLIDGETPGKKSYGHSVDPTASKICYCIQLRGIRNPLVLFEQQGLNTFHAETNAVFLHSHPLERIQSAPSAISGAFMPGFLILSEERKSGKRTGHWTTVAHSTGPRATTLVNPLSVYHFRSFLELVSAPRQLSAAP